jgi:hypothetical protein
MHTIANRNKAPLGMDVFKAYYASRNAFASGDTFVGCFPGATAG